MTEDARTSRLARELDAAFRNRADLYRLLLTELTDLHGPEQAEALLVRVITRRGQEVAAAAFSGFGPNDAALCIKRTKISKARPSGFP